MKTILLPILAALVAAVSSAGAAESRMDRSRLNVGAYYLKPSGRTETNVKEAAECRIDFFIDQRGSAESLELFKKYNIGLIVSGAVPGWWGGNGENAGTMAAKNPIASYASSAKKFVDHPAIWGIDIGDEPSALDFPHYGKVYEEVKRLFPNQFPHINLYPNYAVIATNSSKQTVNQLGTRSYTEHIAAFVKNVKSDYICFDFYPYSFGTNSAGQLEENRFGQYLENLRVVGDAATGSGRSMWFIPQVNSRYEHLWTSESQLRFQAYSAMAFGAETITWACYTPGWWENFVIGKDGKKTRMYGKLKKVNAEIHRFGVPFMKYRRSSTALVGFDRKEWLSRVKQASVASASDGVFNEVRAEDGSALIVGSMKSRAGDGLYAIFVCSAADPFDTKPAAEHILRFRADNHTVKAMGCAETVPVRKNADGSFSVNFKSSEALLIEAYE